MPKILTGSMAAIVVAAGGVFGFQFYMQHRIASEVEAAFEQIRATGAKASHGNVSFDPWSRTFTIADIAGESTAQPPFVVKIASVTAAGVGKKDGTRFSADSIEVTGVEIGVGTPVQGLLRVIYRLPRMVVKDYSGPASVQGLPASSSFLDLYRFGFQQLASVTAASVTAPGLTGTIQFSAAMPDNGGEFSYSGLTMEGIKDGKIASSKLDGLAFTFAAQTAGKG